jgi:hypothetical protein
MCSEAKPKILNEEFEIVSGEVFLRVLQGCQMVYIFYDQKSQLAYVLEGLGMKNVGYILRPAGMICGRLV